MNSSRRLITGLLLIIGPWGLLICTLCAYAITSFVISEIMGAQTCTEVYCMPEQDIRIECEGGDTGVIIGNLIRIALGAFGMAGVVGILVGNPFGLYLLFSAMIEDQKKVGKK